MSKKKAVKAKAARGVRNLPAKTLTDKQARHVKGGKASKLLMQACATGKHFDTAKLVV